MDALIKDIKSSPFNRSGTFMCDSPLDSPLTTLALRLDRNSVKKIDPRGDYCDLDKQYAKEVFEIIQSRVPEFQRSNDKWTPEMQVSFMKNALMGNKANPVLFYDTSEDQSTRNLLDGLQRITATARFFIDRDMIFSLSGGQEISAEEIISAGSNYAFWNHSIFPVKGYRFSNDIEAVDFYIAFNENITHSQEDIKRAKAYRQTLLGY
ncbi:DUF262 domain-containing protein [Vibrio vulnificus]|nr:DUF262 domain-containing protein [Vibrio vulnificus]